MRNAKRILSLLLIVVMIVPMCVTQGFAAPASSTAIDADAIGSLVGAPADSESETTETALANASTIAPALDG